MNRQLNSPSGGATIANVLQPYEGGLGTTTAAAALAAMGGVASTQVGVANGVAQLAGDGLISPDNVPADGITLIAVQGPNNMGINSMATFEITNYDAFTTYDLVALAGTVVRNKSTITYYSSGSAGPSGFRINGRLVSVTIVGDRPAAPTLTVVTAGSSKSVSAILTSSAFVMNSGTGTHSATDWQIATDSLFDNVVKSSMFNSTSLTTMTFDGLDVLKTYYARNRYRDNNGNYSPWSAVVAFATKDDYRLETEEAKLVQTYTGNDSGFAAVAMAGDGTRIIVSGYNENANVDGGGNPQTGSVYIFVRNGLSWALEARLQPADVASADLFGFQVAIDATGLRIAASSTQADPDSISSAGKIYVFIRNGVTWTQEASFYASDKVANQRLGNRIHMDQTGTRVVAASGDSAGQAYVFVRSGTTWSQETKLTKPAIDTASTGYGEWVAFDGTATRVAVGSISCPQTGNGAPGGVHVFVRSGSTWTLETTLYSAGGVSGRAFGARLDLSYDGSVVVICAYGENTFTGAAYIFKRNGTVWTQIARFVPADVATNTLFGNLVAITGDGKRVIVACYKATTANLAQAGAIYVYADNGATWVQESRVSNSDPVTLYCFGASLDISSDGTRFVGTRFGNSTAGTAAAYIYR